MIRRAFVAFLALLVLYGSIVAPARAWVPAAISLGLAFKPPGLPGPIKIPPRFPTSPGALLPQLLQTGMQLAVVQLLQEPSTVPFLNLAPSTAPNQSDLVSSDYAATVTVETQAQPWYEGSAFSSRSGFMGWTRNEACGAVGSWYAGRCSANGFTCTATAPADGGGCCAGSFNGSSSPQCILVSGTTTCPTGWTVSGSNCTRNVYTCPLGGTHNGSGMCVGVSPTYVNDGVPTRKADSDNWIPDTRDTDPDTLGVQPEPYENTGLDETGKPTHTKIEAMPDGSIKITRRTQGDAGGQTVVGIDEIVIAPDGKVQRVDQTIQPGNLTQAPTAVPTTPGTSTPVTVTGGNVTVTLPDLPTDYNREATQQDVRAELQKMNTDGVKIKETDVPTKGDYTDPLKSLDDAKQLAIDGITAAATADGRDTSLGWGFSLPTGCQPFDLDLPAGFGSIEIDVCEHQPVFHDLMSMIWAMAAVFGCTALVWRTLNEG